MQDEPEQGALFEIEGPDEDGCVWLCNEHGQRCFNLVREMPLLRRCGNGSAGLITGTASEPTRHGDPCLSAGAGVLVS